MNRVGCLRLLVMITTEDYNEFARAYKYGCTKKQGPDDCRTMWNWATGKWGIGHKTPMKIGPYK